MITIVNTGTSAVRVAGRYLQPGEQCPVAEETAAWITRYNPAVAVVTDADPADVKPPDPQSVAPKAAPRNRRRS